MGGRIDLARCRIIDVDALKRGREAVGVTFAALLAVGDDIEAGALLVTDGEKRSIVLRVFEKFRSYTPQLPRPHAWWKTASKLVAVDQPIRLRIGTHE